MNDFWSTLIRFKPMKLNCDEKSAFLYWKRNLSCIIRSVLGIKGGRFYCADKTLPVVKQKKLSVYNILKSL